MGQMVIKWVNIREDDWLIKAFCHILNGMLVQVK